MSLCICTVGVMPVYVSRPERSKSVPLPAAEQMCTLFCQWYSMDSGLPCAGQLTFNDVMKMFRDELLDLNAILNYIKLAPDESAATTSTVSSLQGVRCNSNAHKPDRASLPCQC